VTDFHRLIHVAHTPSGDRDHISIGRESADIERKYPAQNIDFADDEFSAPYIDKSELEAQKHLLDRSIAAHGGFEDA
jgi:hypothetical protein